MKAASAVLIASSLLAVAPSASRAQTRFFVGGGPTGTSEFGFRGGWGATLGFEQRLAEAGALVVRAEGASVPSTARAGAGYQIFPLSTSDLGESGPRSSDATLLSLMAGLRLGGRGRLSPYLDALVGVGYVNDPADRLTPLGTPTREHTNLALGIGPGIAIRAPFLPELFADVHYDFYSSRGASTPIIPVRVGLMTR